VKQIFIKTLLLYDKCYTKIRGKSSSVILDISIFAQILQVISGNDFNEIVAETRAEPGDLPQETIWRK